MNDCIRKLANGHWNTRYVGPDGRRYSRTFRVKQDATYWRSHELPLIDLDQWSSPPSRNAKPAPTSVLTVAEWAEQCIQARENRSGRPIRPTTADVCRKLARLTVTSSPLGGMPLKDVTRDDVSAWREALPARTRTQNGKAYELLVSIFGDAVREGKITVSPATLRGAGTPERARGPHTMTATEINAYLNAADPKWRVALLLSVTCALRIGETLA